MTPSKHKRLTPTPFSKNDVSVHANETVYHGYAKVFQLTLQHALFDGGTSSVMTRELFSSGDAVMVIPFDVKHQTILLVEQFRVAPLVREGEAWMFEGVAGRIDKDEQPHDVARRETVEEAGCHLGELEKIGGFYQSPGIFAEHITYYCGQADLSGAGGIFGLEEEDENIRAVVVDLDEAIKAVQSNHIVSAPTALALLWLDRNRDRLTRQWQGD